MFRLVESGLFVVLVYLVVSIAAVFTAARAMSNEDVVSAVVVKSPPTQQV